MDPTTLQSRAGLEAQMRNMQINNVKLPSNQTNQASSQRGNQQPRGRGRGGFSRGSPNQRNQSQDPNTPVSTATSPSVRGGRGNSQRRQPQATPQDGVPQMESVPAKQYRNYPPRPPRQAQQHEQPGQPGQALAANQQSPKVLQRPQHNNAPGNFGPGSPSPQYPPRQYGYHMQQQYTNQSTESTLIQIQHLDQLAAQEIPKVEMKPEELEEKEVFRKYLEDICKNALVKNYSGDIATIALVGFGSLASGFATPGSDMDLAIVPTWKDVINAEKTEIDHNIPRLLERAILDAKLGARLLTRTRVPILKVCQHPTEELFTALFDERKKWDELPEGEQYPPPLPPLELAGQSGPLLKADLEPPGVVQQSNFPELNAIKPSQVNPETHKKAKSKADPKPTGAVQHPNFPKLDGIKAYGVYLENLKKEKAKANALKFSTRKKESIPTTAGSPTPTIPLQGNTNSKNPKKESVPTTAGSPTPTTPLQGNTDSRDPKKERHPHHDRPWAREKTLGPLDFPKSGVGIQCDVNFENPLGIHNTQLLRCYSLCDPRVRPMVLFVKSWAKRRKINSSYSGTLSSYGWVLMVLHYLVNVAQPPVCPNLQLCRPSTGPQAAEEIVIQGHSVRFWRNEAEIIQAAKLHQLSRNMQSIGALLRGFFQYFSGLSTGYGPNRTPSFHWTGEVLSLRTQGGILTKQMKGWTGAKTTISNGREVRHRYLISIEDPFELDHNVARTVTHNGIVAIRDEFRRAWRILNAIGSGIQPEGGFFDEVVEKPPPPPTPETKEPALA